MPTSLSFMSLDEMRDVSAGRRDRWSWAADYPTEGDVIMARLSLTQGRIPTAEWPWGPLQVRVDGQAVGGAGFKGQPSDDGTVEIGYGIAQSHRGRGVAREAVRLLLDLAAAHAVTRVIAETEPDNIASQRVLQRCGFTRLDRPEYDTLWWERGT